MRKTGATQFQVVVIGAGPAGGSAAFMASQLGLSTALIDKKHFPRQKLCGGLFTARSKRYFKEIFGEDIPRDLLLEKTDIDFRYKGHPIGSIHDIPPLFLTMRWDLDEEIYRRAISAGAADFTGHKISSIDLKSRRLTLGGGKVIEYQILIGADGVNSMVAKEIWGNSFDRRKIGFGLEIEAKGRNIHPERPIRIDFAAANWGYGWVFPKPGSTTIGVGGILGRNPNMKSSMAAYLGDLGVPAEEKEFKGQFIPFGDFRKTPGRDRVILCGDAAGLVDPITGEGIAYAMKSGQLAAESAACCLEKENPGALLKTYKGKLQGIHSALRMANLIRPLLFLGAFEKVFENSFRSSKTLKREYMRLLAGDVEYKDILWKVFRRTPKLLKALIYPTPTGK